MAETIDFPSRRDDIYFSPLFMCHPYRYLPPRVLSKSQKSTCQVRSETITRVSENLQDLRSPIYYSVDSRYF
ncbi:hypothetical protein PUN28_017521 [Cardiocondyla obscurior]|uniref:Uncharacterized protein n=1 Tax=Cardiocondyla obscurior TaxID=286306 RepID=A0AAW2EJB7_9HYME